MESNKAICLLINIIFILNSLFAKQKSKMIDCPKIDYCGIVVSIEYCPDSVYGCIIPQMVIDSNNREYRGVEGYCLQKSAFYNINLKNAFVSWTDSSDTLHSNIIRTGGHEVYVTRLSPREEVESIKLGDTIEVVGYNSSGDEFSQVYFFDSMKVAHAAVSVINNQRKTKKKVSNYASTLFMSGKTQLFYKKNSSVYYTVSGKRVNALKKNSGIFITNQP